MTAPDSPFTEFELLEIGYTTEEHAARYFGGPMHFDATDAARYTTEGHLDHLVAAHGLRRVWDAVADFIGVNPEVLERDERQRAARQAERQSSATELRRAAKQSYNRAEYDRAEELILAAQRLDPRFGGFDSIRNRIAAARTAARV